TPLYVLDGVAIEPGPNGYLTGVNPNDIDSIEVLKEPAETALYGVRGANGVIIVKTKRPGHPRRPGGHSGAPPTHDRRPHVESASLPPASMGNAGLVVASTAAPGRRPRRRRHP